MEVGKYVKCLRGFAYAITDNKGYYKIDEMHEDGSGVLEVVWHENTDYIGRKEGVLHLDDFEEVDESVVFEKFDEEISGKYRGWGGRPIVDSPTAQIIYRNLKNHSDVSTQSISTDFFRQIFAFLFVPSQEDFDMPKPTVYARVINTYETPISSIVNYSRDYVVSSDDNKFNVLLFTRRYEDIEGDVAEYLSHEYEEIEFPAKFLMPYKVKKAAVRVLKKDCLYVAFITEEKSVHLAGVASVIANDIGKPFTEEIEDELLHEKRDKYFELITAGVDEWFESTKDIRRQKKFEQFTSDFSTMRSRSYNRDIDRTKEQIDQCESQLRDLFRKKQELIEKQFYAEHGLSTKDEFIEMLKDSSNQPIARIDGDSINFCVVTPLTYWDDDLYDIIRKSDDNFNRLSNAGKLLMDEIFRDRTVKLLFEQKFRFRRGSVAAYSGYEYYSADDEEGFIGIPNPHMHFYDCWGSHKPYIEEALSTSDYMTAYAQAVAAVSGVTLDDGAVMNKFFNNHLFDDPCVNKPCLQLQDGTRITVKQYLDQHKDDKWEE